MNFRSRPNEFRPRKLRGSKREVLIFFFSSLSLNTQNSRKWEILPQMRFFFFSFYTLDTWLTLRHVSPPVRVCFCSKTIYFVPVKVQIFLYELYLNYYPTSKIFFKNLIFGVHRTPVTPKNVKIPTVLEFDENFLGN